jgi:hypothetical protein
LKERFWGRCVYEGDFLKKVPLKLPSKTLLRRKLPFARGIMEKCTRFALLKGRTGAFLFPNTRE